MSKNLTLSPKLIYSISHPLTGIVVYVGSTQDLYGRLVSHMHNPSPELKPWFEELRSNMLVPIIEEIDRTGELSQADLEHYWIQQFIAWGFPLVNKNGRPTSYYYPASIAKRRMKNKKLKVKYDGPLEMVGYAKVKIPTDDLIKWKSQRNRKDASLIENVAGITYSQFARALTTGTCTPEIYNAINFYFSKKAA